MSVNESKVGDFSLLAGTIEENRLRILAYIKDCDKDNCSIADKCRFKPKGKCTVINNALTSLYREWTDIENGVGDRLDQMQLNRIGMHLIPLYHMLIRFNIESNVLRSTIYTSSKTGRKHAWPQFREARETIKLINSELKEIGLERLWRAKFGNEPMPGPKPIEAYTGDEQKHGQRGGYQEATGDSGVK